MSDSFDEHLCAPIHAQLERLSPCRLVVCCCWRCCDVCVSCSFHVSEWGQPVPPPELVAFSEPLEAGTRLAQRYCRTRSFLTY